MKMSFEVAAKQQLEDEENAEPKDPWFEFSVAGQEFVVPERPTASQNIVVIAAMAEGGAQPLRAMFAYLDNILEGDGGRRLKRLLERKVIEFDLLYGGDEQNEGGIVDTIMSLASENPTDEPSGSSSSSAATSKRSTGRSPSKASTRSS